MRDPEEQLTDGGVLAKLAEGWTLYTYRVDRSRWNDALVDFRVQASYPERLRGLREPRIDLDTFVVKRLLRQGAIVGPYRGANGRTYYRLPSARQLAGGK